MTYKGRVKGGVIVLEDENRLAEGTKAHIEPVEETTEEKELSPLAKTLPVFPESSKIYRPTLQKITIIISMGRPSNE